jgi:uncharacterized protein
LSENPSREEIRAILTHARTVAVVGLSADRFRTSHFVARSLQTFGFDVRAVNPNLEKPVLGVLPHASLTEIKDPIDVVDVFRRSEKVLPVAHDAVAVGAQMLWMQSGVVNHEAADYARGHGLTVVMDRCIKVDYLSLVGA